MSRALWTPQYYQKVLSLDPFVYFMLDEKSGAVAYDLVSGRVAGAMNGAHSGVTLGQPGIGDGRTSLRYDGVNDYTNAFTAAFAVAFSGAAGTIILWAKVFNADVWTDGANRIAFRLDVDATNLLYLRRETTNNVLEWRFRGTTRVKAGLTTTDWICMGLTWEGITSQAYYNGVAEGAALASGAWVGVPYRATIGAASVPAAAVWNGYLDHVPMWDRALSADEMAELAVRE